MKKIIIGACFAMLGIAANAAATNWYVSNIKEYAAGGSSKAANGYASYFFDDAIYSRTDALNAIANGNVDFISKAYLADYQEDGEAGTESGKGSYGNEQTITGYAIIFNDENAADATYAYVTQTQDKTTGKSGQAASFSFNAADSAQASSWVQVAPEPTSGLLLLIGMAGLALRRRRA